MKLIYFKSDIGNFGDDLNPWLWPQLFPGLFQDTGNETACFLGIGSILYSQSRLFKEAMTYQQKYVFGTGVRSPSDSIELDETWNIIFLRGPQSSQKLLGHPSQYISDAAYCLTLTDRYRELKCQPKKFKVSYMPYFRSLRWIDWKVVCQRMSWNLISPTEDVERILEMMAQSELVITEAMHGAILADVLRIPWKRVGFYASHHEGSDVAEFKWSDWAQSINLEINAINIPFMNVNMNHDHAIYRLAKKIVRGQAYQRQVDLIVEKLCQHAKIDESISSDNVFDNVINECLNAKEQIEKSVL